MQKLSERLKAQFSPGEIDTMLFYAGKDRFSMRYVIREIQVLELALDYAVHTTGSYSPEIVERIKEHVRIGIESAEIEKREAEKK